VLLMQGLAIVVQGCNCTMCNTQHAREQQVCGSSCLAVNHCLQYACDLLQIISYCIHIMVTCSLPAGVINSTVVL
jgi:hypothetical protein